MKFPHWLYKHMERHGCMRWFVQRLWPGTHYCPEMDDMLVTSDFKDDCFCGMWPENDIDRERRLADFQGLF